ncbi:MAG: 50S ribosomal protein L6 [Calditrichia bacterium]
MSRIGKLPIEIPGDVKIDIANGLVKVKGPKGELEQKVDSGMILKMEDGTLNVDRPNNERKWRSLHGLTRTLINNMVVGVTKGYTINLEIEGVGYKVEKKPTGAMFTLGYSHPIFLMPPKEISIDVASATKLSVSGIDKVLVGQIAAKVRSFRPPEPYKGKGIRYENEVVRRKAGKTAK